MAKMKDDEHLEQLFAKMSKETAREIANQNSPTKREATKKTTTKKKETKKTK